MQRLVAYHWYPVGHSVVADRHFHIGSRRDFVGLGMTHFPSGQISLIAVLRCTIVDLGVRPLRMDWSAVLEQAEPDLAP